MSPDPPLRVLYLEHGPLVSGGQHSLAELLKGRPAEIHAVVACPPGPLSDLVRALGVRHEPISGTDGSLRLHPLQTPRAVVQLIRMAGEVRRLARGQDIVHANSIRAGLVALLAFGPRRRQRHVRVVVHLRDSLPATIIGRVVRGAITAAADAVIAISAHTARNFGLGRPVVIHNPVDVDRFRPGVGGGGRTLAVVGQISPWKGQDRAIEIVARLRRLGVDCRLLIVGEAKFVAASTRFDNREYERRLHRLVEDLGLDDAVEFTGERSDVETVLQGVDVLLVPSWEEPFGRTVIEGMATGIPVVSTDKGGPPEIIEDGVSGYLRDPDDISAWVTTVREALENRQLCERVGRSARATVEARFTRPVHVDRVLAVYRSLSD